MDFDDLLSQVLDLLQRDQRVSYRALKRRFGLDDDYLEDIKDELIYAKKLAVDEDNRVLVWTRGADTTPTASPTSLVSKPAAYQTIESERAPASYTPAYLAEKILTAKSGLEGERKVVTVLFADIKDSTELIRDLDPEDAQQLLDPAIHIMMEAVHRFEGTVNQVLGDGIMSIFGAPIAHEDHAARACYAALAMQATMRDYTDEVRRRQGLELRIRVGLNSGEVVVRTIGNDLHMDYSAVGSTTHLAARMEQLASPGSIRLSSSTLRLVEGLVQVNDLGPIPVKGMDEPVEVYDLTGASSIRRRLQAAVARGLTRFVGRDTEIDILNQALETARNGHGQLVAAVGEAGVGKSRLTYEFVHSHRTQGWLILESASVSYGRATPYFPVIDLLKRYVHIEDGDDARTIRAKVTGQILTLDETLQEAIPALLSMVDALPEDSPFLQLDPPQRRQRTLDGLKRILLRESQVQPLVLVFEDLHWHDGETQALLDSLVESLPTAQLLLLVNYRPEYNHGWSSKTYYTQLRLDPLPPERAEEFLEALLGDDVSLEPLKKLLIKRTEGNPFFLEESVRTLVETQILAGEPGAYRLAQHLPSIQVPPTVQAVLAARMDRLPQDEKQLLQTAAVIGTEVPFTLLRAIAEIPDEALNSCLAHLQATEFLYETSLFPERVYTFSHALTHDVAYNSLLQERRRVLHARIVEALETLTGDRLAEQVERVAHHALRGEVWDKALMYFRQAGTKAMEQSAYQEAVVRFEQALTAWSHLPESRDTMAQGIDVQCDLRQALVPLRAFEPGFEYLCVAETLAERLDDRQRLGRIYTLMTHYFWLVGEYECAIERGQRALTLTASSGYGTIQATLNNHLGQIYYALGDYHHALDALRQNVAFFTGERLYERAGMIGPVLGAVGSHAWIAHCLEALGGFAEGRRHAQEAVRIAEVAAHRGSTIYAHYGLGRLALRQGELSQAILALDRALAHCRAANISLWHRLLATTLGVAYALFGRSADAVSILEEALTLPEGGSLSTRRYMYVSLGEAALVMGRLDEAHTHAIRALELAHKSRERGDQAWTHRLLGALCAHDDSPDNVQAETHYQQALDLANELGMRPLQAHCHRGLGTLYSQTGQSEQARTELSTAIAMYRDMDMTFWLPETETALAAVEDR